MDTPMLIAANWKLNKSPSETTEYFKNFLNLVKDDEQSQFVFFTPSIDLPATASSLTETGIAWGAQNVYSKESGAFTGETSAKVVADLKATHCLVGHSERRQIFAEVDSDFADKVELVQSLGMCPMLCIGETLEDRESQKTEKVLKTQLEQSLAKADFSKPLVVAYEPVWAIGTGKVATPQMANETHQFVRTVLDELAGESSSDIAILYGGSVKASNAKELSAESDIDGFLVGGASLAPESFYSILEACS